MAKTMKWGFASLGQIVETLEGKEMEGYDFVVDGDFMVIRVLKAKE